MIGHNTKLTEEENKALFMEHVRKDMAINDKIKALQAEKKSGRKVAQADGYMVADIEFASKTIAVEDKSTVTNRHSSHAQVLYWLGLNPGFQGDLFKDRSTALEKIGLDGERAGWRAEPGVKRESGYSKGSNEDVEWLAGWDRSQELRGRHLQSAMEKKAAERGEAQSTVIKGKGAADGAKPEGEKPGSEAPNGAEVGQNAEGGTAEGNGAEPEAPGEQNGAGVDVKGEGEGSKGEPNADATALANAALGRARRSSGRSRKDLN